MNTGCRGYLTRPQECKVSQATRSPEHDLVECDMDQMFRKISGVIGIRRGRV